jgi:diacylglycerol O-acyltransferase
VRGPARTMYLHGAAMRSHFPVSIPAHSIALNLTVQTYVDRIDLGVTACLEAVPDVGALRDDIVAGWLELKAAALPPLESPVRIDIPPLETVLLDPSAIGARAA